MCDGLCNPPSNPCTPMCSTRRKLFVPSPRALLAAGLFWAAALVVPSFAAEEPGKEFHLPADVAARSLKNFARQSGVEVIIPAELSREVQTNAVDGRMSSREALDRMLAGTGLTVVEDPKTGALAVSRSEAPPLEKNAAGRTPPLARVPALETTTAASSEVVLLSPFEVRADSDIGYQAANTTSGSRLNTRLKDTPAAIDPFTPEFLADIGATNLAEMLAYATDIEADVEDSIFGFQNGAGRDVTGAEFPFRMRGMAGGVSRDFVESAAPTDLYNVERADVASGPNSGLASKKWTVV